MSAKKNTAVVVSGQWSVVSGKRTRATRRQPPANLLTYSPTHLLTYSPAHHASSQPTRPGDVRQPLTPALSHKGRGSSPRPPVAAFCNWPPTTAHGPLPPSAARRRGVLLLVILSLLILFVMMAVTYVLVATRHYATAKSYGRVGQTGDPPQKLLEGAMMQLVRGAPGNGTNISPFRSVIGPWSLLEHMYGMYTAKGTISGTPASVAGGQIVEFNASLTAADPAFALSGSLTSIDGYFDGCVITMTSGQANGLTSRIVRYDATSVTAPYHVLAFKGTVGPVTLADKDTFIINGRAFSGTGFGNSSVSHTAPIPPAETGLLDAKDANGNEFALLPNPVAYTPSNTYKVSTDFPNGVPFGGLGGGNVDYSAPDYQNMYMSWTVDQVNKTQVILPSFHRPDLINYWMKRKSITTWDTSNIDLLRQIMLRPNPIDHPNFTGSNPAMTSASWQKAILGQDATGTFIYPRPWDVDNDGDGLPDSVWVDLGYPVQSTIDGRLYKPLFAIHCVDLDGRLNLNTSGSTEEIPTGANTQSSHSQQFVGMGYVPATAPSGLLYVQAPYAKTDSSTPPFQMPRGEGLGPAEVLLYDPTNVNWTNKFPISQADFVALLRGGTVNLQKYEGRYGDALKSSPPEAGDPTATKPSPLALVKRFQFPDMTFNPSTNSINPLSAYNSPTDLWGRMTCGLDYRGQPLYWKPRWVNETLNSPYDINLSHSAANPGSVYGTQSDDNPFTAFELESILRPNDIDSSDLAPRLSALLQGSLNSNPSLRRRITTESWDVPSPPVVAPKYLRDNTVVAQPERDALQILYGRRFATNIVELLGARLAYEIKKTNPALTDNQVQTKVQPILKNAVRQLLAPELIAGLRMNVNRPFGDGRDGDNNRVVDEPTMSELQTEGQNASTNKWTWLDPSLATKLPPPPALDLVNGVDVNGDGVVDINDQLLARQLYARHLYVLARLMMDDNDLQNVGWFPNETFPLGQKAAYTKELAIRRIAQWAVNVADAMDPDNIMTPFEYDVSPFSSTDPTTGSQKVPGHPEITWAVDGILDDGITPNNHDDSKPWRRLVWGCEGQPLLITETFAMHDRRVADTSKDTSGKERKDFDPMGSPPKLLDPDLDQIRIPEGSLFVELYATHNNNNPTASGDLYTYFPPTRQWYLDLAKLAPAGKDDPSNPSHTSQYPVWRLAISKPHPPRGQPVSVGTTPSPQTFGVANAETASFETKQTAASIPADPNATGSLLYGVTANQVEVDRFVWFANLNPAANPSNSAFDADRIYYGRQYFNPYRGNTANVPAGGYAVVGPRDVTSIGSKRSTGAGPKWGDPSLQKITLSKMASGNPSLGITDLNGLTDYPSATQIKPPVAIVAGANPPAAWTSAATTAPTGIGINVSEPLPQMGYYPEPTHVNPSNGRKDAYDDLASPTGTFIDTPFEKKLGGSVPNTPVSQLPNGPRTETTLNYRSVFLQRLANPLAPYNVVSNPYLTVDWMPVDLTVFNGEDYKPGSWDMNNLAKSGQWDPDDDNPNADTLTPLTGSVAFGSRERGQFSKHASSDDNVWTIWPDRANNLTLGGEDPPFKNPDHTRTTVNFQFMLHDTTAVTDDGDASLGFLNHSYGPPIDTTDPRGSTPQYIGDPKKPFPWLVWNNRPYSSISELMMVPASHPGRLMLEFSMAPTTPISAYTNDASTTPPAAPAPGAQPVPFAHLLNFFREPTTTNPNVPSLAPILDYLQVPSPFVGTETVLNPQKFHGDWWKTPNQKPGETGSSPAGNEPTGTAGLHPPFNMVSNYRDPGRVNINTVPASTDVKGKDVWNALLGGDSSDPTYGPPPSNLIASRAGYGGSTGYAFDSTGKSPSLFGNPFRSAVEADMAPFPLPVRKPIDATLWRADGATNNATYPMLALGHQNAPANPNNYNDYQRNAYFYFQPFDRLASKVTTRSNVYAVWITVGYFEVSPWYGPPAAVGGAYPISGPVVIDPAHPDGYQLGQELGADTGEIERHRGFYIIDRSIPVGFQRGQDNNAGETVLLKRFIE